MRWPRRTQRRRGRLCANCPVRRPGVTRRAVVRDHDDRALRARRLAQRARGHPRGDGGFRCVLEAGVARARGDARAGARERAPRQERARAQVRRERRDVARGLARARAGSRQLRATCAHPGSARPIADAQAAHARDHPAHQSDPEGARGREHQAGERDQQRARQERSRDSRGHHRWSE